MTSSWLSPRIFFMTTKPKIKREKRETGVKIVAFSSDQFGQVTGNRSRCVSTQTIQIWWLVEASVSASTTRSFPAPQLPVDDGHYFHPIVLFLTVQRSTNKLERFFRCSDSGRVFCHSLQDRQCPSYFDTVRH